MIPNDLRLRLSTHSLLDNDPSLARQTALREAARVALVRLKYSMSLRRAEFSRARRAVPWDSFKMGDIVYFYRQQKVAPGGGARGTKRKRLILNQWHGPGMITALEGGRIPTAAYVSYRGNLTKCGIEHLRPASTLERLAMSEWEELLSDVINASVPGDDEYEPTEPSQDAVNASEDQPDVERSDEREQLDSQEGLAQPTSHFSSSGAPHAVQYPYPFQAQDLIPMMQMASTQSSAAASIPASSSPSRRTSTSSMPPSALSRQSSMAKEKVVLEESKLPAVVEEPSIDETAQKDPIPADPSEGAAGSLPSEAPPPVESSQAPSLGELPRLERAQGSVRRALSEGAAEERSPKRRPFVPLLLAGKSIDVLLAEQDTCIHPLLRAMVQAQDDISNHYLTEGDHGTWDGRWPLPSRSVWEAYETLGWSWPEGSIDSSSPAFLARQDEQSVLLVQTGAGNHKEMRWSQMDEPTRQQFRVAAEEQWQKWTENGAVEVLNLHQSRAVFQELERKGELDRVLKPRFVLTDKNASLRTPETPLPLKASARIVVPGYRDLANLQNELRRDAPTGSRLAQHVLFCIAASEPSWWLRSADVRAAFLKGDPYVQRVLYICGSDPAKGPTIPIPNGAVAKVLKGVFGLADAPREWWLRLSRELKQEGWTISLLDGALWYLWLDDECKPGSKKLAGAIVGHVDDLLFTGNDIAVRSLLKLGET